MEGGKEKVEEFKNEFGKYGSIRVMKMGQWVGDDSNIVEKGKQKKICDILYNTINILCNGDYALCCFDAEGIVHKNVMKDPIIQTWRNGIFRNIRMYHIFNHVTNKECINCSFARK